MKFTWSLLVADRTTLTVMKHYVTVINKSILLSNLPIIGLTLFLLATVRRVPYINRFYSLACDLSWPMPVILYCRQHLESLAGESKVFAAVDSDAAYAKQLDAQTPVLARLVLKVTLRHPCWRNSRSRWRSGAYVSKAQGDAQSPVLARLVL